MPSAGAMRLPIARETALTVTAVVAWCGMTMFVVSPLVAPFLLVGCLLIAMLWWYYDDTSAAAPSRYAMLGVLAVAGWFALTILWSVNKRDAAFAAFLFAASGGIALVTSKLLDGMSADVRRVIALAFTFAVGFAMWLSLEESASGMFLRRMLNSFVPLTRPHSVHLRLEGGWIASMQPYVSNKNVAAVTLMAWPMILVSGALARTHGWMLARYATVAAVVLAVALSEHETSKLALVASGLIFGIALWSQRTAFALTAVGWTAATLLVVPVSLMAFSAGAYKSEGLQFSARHRLVIWGSTSLRVLDKPLLGHGLASTRVLDEMARPVQGKLAGTDISDGTNMHAHNVFLQAWYETGAVGGVLMFLAGLPVLGWLRTRSDRTAPYLFAAFSAAVVVASLSWSLVASWYIATYGLVAVWCRFGDLFVRDFRSSDPLA